MYYPTPGPVPSAASALPGAEEVELRTEDGLRLGAWFVPASGKPSGLAVLVCNGNGGGRSLRAGLGRGLARGGHALVFFHYRGDGGHSGTPAAAGPCAGVAAAPPCIPIP